eukprot:Rmarinus@m.27468
MNFFEHYTSPRRLCVRHTQLGIVYRLSQFCMIVFVLLQVFLLHLYARYETPVGALNFWTDVSASTSHFGNPPSYCNNSEYDFIPTGNDLIKSGNVTASNISCTIGRSEEITVLMDNSFWVRTMFMDYEDPMDVSNKNCSFLLGIEDLYVNLNHGMETSWITASNRDMVTYIRDHNGRLNFTLPRGDPLRMQLQDIIALTGQSLDSRNPALLEHTDDPFYRVSGMVIVMNVEYTNLRSWDFNTDMECSITFKTLSTVWGYGGAQPIYVHGNMFRRDTTNVMIRGVISGQVGRFHVENFSFSIVSAIVLVKLAWRVVDSLVPYVLSKEDAEIYSQQRVVYLDLQTNQCSPSVTATTPIKRGGSLIDSTLDYDLLY